MKPYIVAFGGGVDSTAMILGLYEKQRPIDLILFADTGGERPETYQHIENFSNWLVLKGLPAITIVKRVRRDGSLETLEKECHRKCHMELDQGNKLSKQERIEIWDEAHRKTIGWLFENELILLKL